jgi:hypothetical protein
MAGSETFASRIEYWEREKRNAVGQAHALNSGIGPEGMTLEGKQAAADRLLDYAASCREIAWRDRISWTEAMISEIREGIAPDAGAAEIAGADRRLSELSEWIHSLPSPGT